MSWLCSRQAPCSINDMSCFKKLGWAGRTRTYECGNQNPVPYHLATAQFLCGKLGILPQFPRRSARSKFGLTPAPSYACRIDTSCTNPMPQPSRKRSRQSRATFSAAQKAAASAHPARNLALTDCFVSPSFPRMRESCSLPFPIAKHVYCILQRRPVHTSRSKRRKLEWTCCQGLVSYLP